MCSELEEAIREIALNEVRQEVLKVFKEVVEGRLTNPEEILNKLTDFEIDYSSAVGMENHSDKWGETSHRNFGKWHEINFSPTGHWLIEFQSTINLDITFHLPYNRRQIIETLIDVDALPLVQSDQAKFGREISVSEQKQYPLRKLLEILGSSFEDFPYCLEEYTKPNYRTRYCENWTEDDWIDEEDELY